MEGRDIGMNELTQIAHILELILVELRALRIGLIQTTDQADDGR